MDNRNKIYFRILSWVLVCLGFVLIEVFLRLFSVGTDMHLFVKHDSEANEKYLKINPYVSEKYFTRFEATSGTNDIFLKQKPSNGFRIFLLGSSTLYGYPYDKNLMASRILHKRLQDAFPGLKVEVVNTSITAINSITLKDYIDQVLKFEPDAVLIYAGHNEFYGAFGIGSRETISDNRVLLWMHFKLINLRTYQLIRSALRGISKQFVRNSEGQEEKGTLMKRIVGDESIEYKGEEYQRGMEQYRSNMSYILEKSQKDEVPVFISDLVSNIKDLPPFGDVEQSGLRAHNSYQEALNSLSEGDTLEAKNLFFQAKDLDPIRFRASEEINEIIFELAEQYKATLIPTKDWFENVSEGGLIGNNLLTEHVHPNIEGQFVLADAFYSSIIASGVTGSVPDPLKLRSKEFYRKHWGYTALDSLIGSYKIMKLKSYWPFSSLSVDHTFVDTFQTSGLLDSLALSLITNPKVSVISLHIDLAEHFEENDDLISALNEYKALIHINPYFPAYYNRAANYLLKLNDLHAAERYLRKSIEFGENLFAYSLLGEIETAKHNYKGAINLYFNAVDLADDNKIEDAETGVLIVEVRRKISEVETLSKSAGQSRNIEYARYIPYNVERLYIKAIAHAQSDPDSAIYYFLRCLEINDCPLVNFQIGNILYQQRDKNALPFYDKAYEGFLMHPDFLARYSVINLRNQNLAKAKIIYHELSKIAPQHPDLPNLKAALSQ